VGLFDALRGRRADAPKPPAQPPPRRVTKVRKELLDLCFAASKDTHPHEFAAGLHADGDTLTELVIVPTQSGPTSAHMSLWTLPIDRKTVGTVHSHPGSIPKPSDADRQLFRHFGHTHIIVAEPYRMGTWRAYDHDGQPIELQVVG
jgi:proteasome lid subunit RPN8/RPN11